MKTTSILRSLVICLVLLTLIPVASSSAASATSNLAPNPSFEKGKRQLVNGWSPMVTSSTFTWNKRTAYSGNRSICISDIGNFSTAEWFTTDFIPVSQGADYIFNAYAKGDLDGLAYLAIWTADASGTVTNHYRFPMSFDNTAWTFTQTSFRPDINTASIRLAFAADDVNPDPTGTGMICFDYVSLEGIPYAMP
jgi:hypothetical protein